MKPRIAYCTIAIGLPYQKISLKLIESFLDNVTDSVLHLFTDDVEFYKDIYDIPNICIDKIHLDESRLPLFDLNCKSLLLDMTYLQYQSDIIVLHDCDMFFKTKVDNTGFNVLKPGMNVYMGENGQLRSLDYFQNQAIYDKGLALSGSTSSQYFLFREGCLIFNIMGQVQKFLSFTDEWQKIYAEVTDKGLVDCAQIQEINLASQRSGFPIHNMLPNPLQESFFYEERNGALNQALR